VSSRITALVLAPARRADAGRNKLLCEVDGATMIERRRAVPH